MVRWAADRGRGHARIDRLVPRRVDRLPLVLAYSAFEGVDVNAVTLGVGDPAVEVTGVPPCGCDACDSGSQEELDLLDEHMLGVVCGQFRHLTTASEPSWCMVRTAGRPPETSSATRSSGSWLTHVDGTK
jgi:hypothetical protein